MSFFLDEDDNLLSAPPSRYKAQQQQQQQIASSSSSAPVWLSQQQQQQEVSQFVCENCGSRLYYYDETAGRDVCQECYTQSQHAVSQQSQEMSGFDYDDIMGLAAKTRGGTLKHHAVRKAGAHGHKKEKLPLNEIDQSTPLPNLDECLEGLQRVLKVGAKILSRDLLHLSDSQTQIVMHTVRELWASYLHAYADGAEHYASLYPGLRISLRDSFITSPNIRGLIYDQVTYAALQQQQKEPDQKKIKQESDFSQQVNTTSSYGDGRASGSGRKRQWSDAETSDDEQRNKESDDGMETMRRQAAFVEQRSKKLSRLSHVLTASTGGSRKGYREAALKLRPSMTMVASLLYLAVAKAGVTSIEICRWIANGELPLINAFRTMISEKLQHRLSAVAPFFQLKHPIHCQTLESTAMLLAVACRMKAEGWLVLGKQGKDCVRFWSDQSLPCVVAKVVSDSGLHQTVLDRTLALMGMNTPKATTRKNGSRSLDHSVAGAFKTESMGCVPTGLPAALPKASADRINRREDILAVVAIACQMDPEWRSWQFERRQGLFCIPWNDGHFRLFAGGGPNIMRRYLDFLELFVLNETNQVPWDKFTELDSSRDESILNGQSTTGSTGSDNSRQPKADNQHARLLPNSVVAGARLDQKSTPGPAVPSNNRSFDFDKQARKLSRWQGTKPSVEPRLRLLIEFLAYSADADADRVQRTMELMLDIKRS